MEEKNVFYMILLGSVLTSFILAYNLEKFPFVTVTPHYKMSCVKQKMQDKKRICEKIEVVCFPKGSICPDIEIIKN